MWISITPENISGSQALWIGFSHYTYCSSFSTVKSWLHVLPTSALHDVASFVQSQDFFSLFVSSSNFIIPRQGASSNVHWRIPAHKSPFYEVPEFIFISTEHACNDLSSSTAITAEIASLLQYQNYISQRKPYCWNLSATSPVLTP